MRLTVRWQRHLDEHLQGARDVDCRLLDFDPDTLRGRAICAYSTEPPISPDWLQDGQLIELLNGFRVLAVGKINSR